MSILQELRSLAGGGQNTLPSCRTIALLCINPPVKSSALQRFFERIILGTGYSQIKLRFTREFLNILTGLVFYVGLM